MRADNDASCRAEQKQKEMEAKIAKKAKKVKTEINEAKAEEEGEEGAETTENPVASDGAAAGGAEGGARPPPPPRPGEAAQEDNELRRMLGDGRLKAMAGQLTAPELEDAIAQLSSLRGPDAFEKEEKGGKKKKGKKEKKPKKEKKKKKNAKQKDDEEAEKLKGLWGQIDADGSGALDKGEVAEVMKQMGKEVSGPELDSAMAAIDQDGSGEVEFGEFLAWWQEQDPEAQKQLMMLNELNFDDL